MAVYEINEAQNNANKVNTNKDLVAGYASQQVEETLQKEATKAVEKTSKAESAVRLGEDNKVQSSEEFNASEINNLVSSANQLVDAVSNNKVNFLYDESKDQHVVLVKDIDTNEVIREIPPKEMLDLLKNLEDITGIIYDNKI
jgi:flagellar protein FlaG|tara:strand:- start:135 stop:563 length:429 start_codon:yes stop_codon:yes gene_type:complete